MWLLLSSQLLKIKNDCWAWCCLPEILVVKRLKQRDLNSKASPGKLVRTMKSSNAGRGWGSSHKKGSRLWVPSTAAATQPLETLYLH